ncbi:Methyltransferase FkbM domain containing protein [Novymonas esmeraldas]|uniref:Methyltransferase FkbM domain containing protein n=1 Tax=Novymonas esmeraldas TaxID=1808958 RepID=A0AAW0F776_9TRYP
MVLLLLAGCTVAYVALCVCLHRWVLRTGGLVARTHSFADAAAGGAVRSLEYTAIRGDWGTALVAHEMFQDTVYTRHGVHVPPTGAPLVIDIGANIGLFSMYVLEVSPRAVVVAAEPVAQLCALARQNTSRYGGRVWVEQVGVAAAAQTGVELLLDPRMTAGASMHESEITSPWKAASICTQLSAVGRDCVAAGNMPAQPTLALCTLLEVPVMRWAVVALLTPALLLFAIFLLAAPSQRRRVRCDCVVFAELLRRAASSMHDASLRHHVAAGPIALVKVDVEGAEWDVLMGIADTEWRRIEQLVVEVHDVRGRVRRVEQLLREKGFDEVHVTQEAWASHEVLRIRSVFARRSHPVA